MTRPHLSRRVSQKKLPKNGKEIQAEAFEKNEDIHGFREDA
jgi:hypothetical protein